MSASDTDQSPRRRSSVVVRETDTAFGRFCNEIRPALTNVQESIVHAGGVEGSLAAMWAEKSAMVRAALVPLAPQCSLL